MKKPDSRPFHFKQFSLHHHRSTMKVGTDAVLLGVWTEVKGVSRALDVGCGSGILSLLLAARSKMQVDAVEMDAASFEEAKENFNVSVFSARLSAYHADFNEFVNQSPSTYQLIISNPPFFYNDLKSVESHKSKARHVDSLTYERLISGAATLLDPQGQLSLVLPYQQADHFIQLSKEKGLFLQKQLLIFPKLCSEPKRVNLLLGFHSRKPETDRFIIRNEDGSLSNQYISLLEDYYVSI